MATRKPATRKAASTPSTASTNGKAATTRNKPAVEPTQPEATAQPEAEKVTEATPVVEPVVALGKPLNLVCASIGNVPNLPSKQLTEANLGRTYIAKLSSISKYFNIRAKEDNPKVRDSVREIGIYLPIVINLAGQLVDGNCRYTAASTIVKEANASEGLVPVTVMDIPEDKILEFQISAGIDRKNLSGSDLKRAVGAFIWHSKTPEDKQKLSAFAEKNKISRQTVWLYERIRPYVADWENYEKVLDDKVSLRALLAINKSVKHEDRTMLYEDVFFLSEEQPDKKITLNFLTKHDNFKQFNLTEVEVEKSEKNKPPFSFTTPIAKVKSYSVDEDMATLVLEIPLEMLQEFLTVRNARNKECFTIHQKEDGEPIDLSATPVNTEVTTVTDTSNQPNIRPLVELLNYVEFDLSDLEDELTEDDINQVAESFESTESTEVLEPTESTEDLTEDESTEATTAIVGDDEDEDDYIDLKGVSFSSVSALTDDEEYEFADDDEDEDE